MNNTAIEFSKEQIALLKAKYTTTTTYCKHSGVKLIISTDFQNSFLRGKLIKHSHFIFDLPTPKLLKLAKSHLYDGNSTERALISNAILHRLGLVNTTAKQVAHPLLLDDNTVERIAPVINALVKQWALYEQQQKEFPILPTLVVTNANCDSYPILANALKLGLTRLEEHNLQSHLHVRTLSEDEQLTKDYNEALNNEKAFQSILDNYSARTQPKAYTRKLGKWATKQLAIQMPDIEADKLASVNHYIQSDSLQLSDEMLKSYIKLLEQELPMDDDNYETTHLVIRHLKSKLEAINKDMADYGFLLLEDEILSTGKDTGIVKYSTKTKIIKSTVPQKIAKANRTSSTNTGTKLGGNGSALARMMAKFSTK